MSLIDTEVSLPDLESRSPIVNDFSIVVATANGSGSQTANNVLIRAVFKMGIPVSGKNLFPSNIQGLPTWYTIRISKDGYTARREGTEILVAFNEKTADDDLASLPPGGVCIYNADDIRFRQKRNDVSYYPLPVKQLIDEPIKKYGIDPKQRGYVANMTYVGALAELLGVNTGEVRAAIERHFNKKPKPTNSNYEVVEVAAAYVRANLRKTDPYQVASLNRTDGMILIDGNTAGALGALVGGVSVVAWYPITPATGLADSLTEFAPLLRADGETETTTYAIVQAEDELAAAGIVVGAGWAGARSMTSTSGPGISLMNEFVGLAYFAEVPSVFWDVMRMGPSTGLPTRVSQGDLLTVYNMGHGDTRHVCLLPGTMQECFEFGYKAFDLAERLQTPVMVLSDLDLGMNNWMTAPFEYPTEPMDRGKVLTAEQIDELEQQFGRYGRYKDYDGDGIPYRTLPGNPNPKSAYLTRGTGHNEYAVYSERPNDWQNNMDRLTRKHDTARSLVPQPIVDDNPDAAIGIIAFGSTDGAVQEARDRLRAMHVETSYLRVRALPLNDVVRDFVAHHAHVYVVEMNQDGQLQQLIQLHAPEYAGKVRSARNCNGLPLSARFITDEIAKQEQI
ncbi:MAG: 2-oxoacid:acceptor oxidoreductase subunit alpha [Roseiflexaceae bacterium]|nr:2-oxoacid:acceptor oxidoreductase subunit alpha [Roseiflexaceae bacterium]